MQRRGISCPCGLRLYFGPVVTENSCKMIFPNSEIENGAWLLLVGSCSFIDISPNVAAIGSCSCDQYLFALAHVQPSICPIMHVPQLYSKDFLNNFLLLAQSNELASNKLTETNQAKCTTQIEMLSGSLINISNRISGTIILDIFIQLPLQRSRLFRKVSVTPS